MIPIVKEYTTIIEMQKKSIINVTYRQGSVFKKFKDLENLWKWSRNFALASKQTILRLALLKFRISTILLIGNFLRLHNNNKRNIDKQRGSEFKHFHFWHDLSFLVLKKGLLTISENIMKTSLKFFF